jgi:hypothetical protein
MIYLYCFNDKYQYYKKYIDFLITKYNSINFVIINNIDELNNYIKNNNIKYLNHILFSNINQSLINELNKMNVQLYIYNTNIVNKYDNYSYIEKSNIQIIVYNYNDKIYLSKYLKNILFLPIQINKENNFIKKFNILINCKNKKYNKLIVNQLKKKKIEFTPISQIFKNGKYNDISKYKILINIDNNNIFYNEILLNYCIYNNILIINDNKNKIVNNFLNEYIFDIKFDLIVYFIEYLLNNYNIILKETYKNLNIKINENIIGKISNNFFNIISEKNKLGFIILRHVNSELTNKYWIESYNSIRKFYNNKIIIIDDKSDNQYLTKIELENCEIINTEFEKRGEILPYYYFYKYHFFEKAVIIHDSVFINHFIDFNQYENFKFLWHFTHDWDEEDKEIELLKYLNNDNLIEFYYKKDKWYGCYGAQSIIDYNFIKILQNKYKIFNLLKYIDSRELRMNFERIFALLCMYEKEYKSDELLSIFGIIHHYIHWGYLFDSYLLDKETDKLKNLDIIKVWSGR